MPGTSLCSCSCPTLTFPFTRVSLGLGRLGLFLAAHAGCAGVLVLLVPVPLFATKVCHMGRWLLCAGLQRFQKLFLLANTHHDRMVPCKCETGSLCLL